jgi:hypothetical protein
VKRATGQAIEAVSVGEEPYMSDFFARQQLFENFLSSVSAAAPSG